MSIPGMTSVSDNRRTITRLNPRTLLLAIVVLRVLLSIPAVRYEGWIIHEPDFYSVARMLVDERRLPTHADFPDRPGVMLQADQPPLYYAVLVPIVALFDNADPVLPPAPPLPICFGWDDVNPAAAPVSDRAAYSQGIQNPATTREAIRTANVLMMCAVIVLVYAATRRLASETAALFAAALLAFEPNTLFFSTMIGNEALLLLIASVYVLLITRVTTQDDAPIWVWGGIIVCTLAAALTRLNGWVFLPITLLVIVIVFRSRRWKRFSPQTRRRISTGIGILVIGFALLLTVNLLTTGSLFGRYRELEEVLFAGLPYLASGDAALTVFTAIAWDTGVNSYLSSFAFIGRQSVITFIGWLSLALLLVGVTVGFAIVWRRTRALTLALAGLIMFTCLLVYMRHVAALPLTTLDSTTYIYAPLRYYAPALPAIAIVIGVALGMARGRWRIIRVLAIALLLIWISVQIFSPRYTTRPSQAALIAATQIDSLGLQPHDPTGDGFPRLTASAWAVDSFGRTIKLRFASAFDPANTGHMARIEFTTPQGRGTFCQFPPADRPHPTADTERVYTQVTIPNCPFTLPTGTQIDLRWRAPDGSLSNPISLGELAQELPPSLNCPGYLGAFDDSLIVRMYTAPLQIQADTLYLPAVNWYMLDHSRAFTRAYTLTHTATGTQYTCEGEPRINTYPFAQWTPGENIYFDECPLQLPPDAPPGEYTVTLTVKDNAGNLLPATNSTGDPVLDSRLLLATIPLE